MCSSSLLWPISCLAGAERSLSIAGYNCSYYRSIIDVPVAEWQAATHPYDRFLRRDYLALIENFPPEGMDFVYLLFRCQGRPVGVAYVQLVDFRADEHVRYSKQGWRGRLRHWVARRLNFRLLICGNMLLTGQHAFYFHHSVEAGHASMLLSDALQRLFQQLRQTGEAVNGMLIKDLVTNDQAFLSALQQRAYHSLQFQPTMVLPLPEHWSSFTDYLAALSSKYRVRYRRAVRRMEPLRRQEFGVEQIHQHADRIYLLYRQVADRSDFCMTYLHPDYFLACKERFGDDFKLWGYFLDNKLIGFCTAFRNDADMEAHFLGMEAEVHLTYDLYLNMLYHLIDFAIASHSSRLVLSRTAMEIKSAVGAIPLATSVLITHPTNKVLNSLIKPLVSYLEPASTWIQRQPFSAVRATDMAES